MHLPSTSDLSLYQLALDALASPEPLTISSTTLKSLVEALIDVLIEEKIPATVWVKLPPIQGWQAQLKRYQQQSGVPQTIYLCGCLGDELGEETDVNDDSQFVPVQLAAGSILKQEYFLLILCKQFSSLIVAYQPEPAVLSQSQPLLALCTFERQVIQQVLEGIRGVITEANTTSKELLEKWETLFSLSSASDEKTLLSQLLIKQLQRTEALFQSATTDNLRHQEELLKRAAQELRTPLTNMKTALKLLDSAQLKPIQRQRYMQLLNTECDRQNSLITGLLELVQLESDPQPTVMRSVQLVDIVPGVVSTYQPLAQEKGIQLGYTVPVGLPSVSCLESWLRQIVINLLHNSLKFTPTGGQVRVKVTLQGEYVQLAVSDTGIGIATSELSKIFDSFYRGRPTTAENTGAGLGLTIVQKLLIRCGGSIAVTSSLGEGANFKVLLPVASPTSGKSNF
ncbi:MAG: ATP-binding protein [Cyanobacteriota bacterium]|nr:ATP-binding protein [Cyanobacteriota bacterium]